MKSLWLVAALAACGCAKFPGGTPGPGDTLLVITLIVDGKIRTGTEPSSGGTPYTYMVAFRLSTEANPTTIGPIPVIAPPWGNGFVAGNATNFVWWNPLLSPAFGVYVFKDTLLNQYLQTGVPIRFTDVTPGAKSIRFELNLSQLEPDPVKLATFKSVQVNFLTMDRIPISGTGKFWDALGDGRIPSQINYPITIPLDLSATYDNTRSGLIEPRGDQPDPDLDIVDWSIEVRQQ